MEGPIASFLPSVGPVLAGVSAEDMWIEDALVLRQKFSACLVSVVLK